MLTSRRSFVAGLGALIAAPAIVRAGSLMAVRWSPWMVWNPCVCAGAPHPVYNFPDLRSFSLSQTRKLVSSYVEVADRWELNNSAFSPRRLLERTSGSSPPALPEDIEGARDLIRKVSDNELYFSNGKVQ